MDSNEESISCGLESVNSLNLDQVQDSDCEQKLHADHSSKEGGKEECDGKVDVRALALRLRTAKTVEDVEEILEDKGDLPLQVFSTVISGFGKEKRMDSALILFDWMKKRKVETNGIFGPNLFIYNGLLGVVKQSGQFAKMEAILNEMAEDGITYNVVTYNTLMAIYVEKGECDKALNMLEEIQKNGLTPSPVSYSQALLAYRRMEDGYGALNFFVELLNKMEDKGLKPGSKEWNAVLVACSKASETTAAVQIFKRMVENGEKPTIVSYGALLSALEKGNLYDEALRVWDHMVKVGVEPNAYAYTILASIYTALGNFNRVDAIIQEMVTLGIEVTVVTYNAIITGCARNGMSSAAYEWFHRMKVQNISPNKITYEMLIEALANDGKPRLAYQLYTRAKNEGLTLSTKAYDAVVQSSQANGATIELGLLGPRPADKKKTVQIRKTLTEFYNLAGVPRRSSKPFDRSEIYHSQTQESP
uniref:Pentatricopeptide repeat-containing protein At3g46610 family n=1 Tax=Cajanus cajan TaxID=3821 RepID=A0A151S643_CAJCA|nr:Pentatricopeptide repeat-containing protein At3g46610 family [Cajanus cajan]